MLRQCTIIFACLALAEFIVYATGIRLPSAIIGMLLLTALLRLGWIKLDWVSGIADFLLTNLGLFFVPPGVALMLYFDLIAAEWLAIAAATLVSTVVVLVATGWTVQWMRRKQ